MMASRLTIQSITGTSPYNFYVCDIYENNCSLLGSVSTDSPDPIFILPSLFNLAPQIMIKMIDANNCEIKKILTCDLTCSFQVIINTAECTFCVVIEPDLTCGFAPYIETT